MATNRRGIKSPTLLDIKYPFTVIPSDNYHLVIKDKRGRYHYFTRTEYDGWSQDITPPIEINEN